MLVVLSLVWFFFVLELFIQWFPIIQIMKLGEDRSRSCGVNGLIILIGTFPVSSAFF